MRRPFLRNSLLVLSVLIVFILGAPITVLGQTSALSMKIEKIDDLIFPQNKVFVSISDAQGFPIKNIQSDSFHLSEDGVPISSFTAESFQNFEQPLAIILVLDTSGSMQGKPLEDSITAAKQFNSALASQDVLGVITFADEVTLVQSPTIDRTTVDYNLNNLKAGGATALNDALIDAIGLLKNRSERRVVVLLTDGKQEGASQFVPNDVINEAVRWSVPIYTIGFGNVDKNQLEQFSQFTGGTAQINPDSSTVASAFESVLNALREQYAIEYISALAADGLEHSLEVSIEYQNGFTSAARNFVARPAQVSVNLLEPSLSDPIGGTIRLVVEGLTPSTIRQVEIALDGQPLTTLQISPFEYLWDSTSVQPGKHNLEIAISDQAGNTGTESYEVVVRAPIEIDIGVTENERIGGEVTIPVNIDSIASISKVDYFIDSTQITEVSSPPYDFTWDTQQYKPGSHEIRVLALDVNGDAVEASIPVIVEMQRNNNLLWISLVVLLVAGGIIIPFSLRSRRKLSGSSISGPSVVDPDPTQIPDRYQTQYILVETSGLNAGQEWPLPGEKTRLGRKQSENDIPLQGLSASRNHALIDQTPDGCQISAIHNDNPIKINGNPVNTAYLKPGDIIEIGESSFRFEVKA